MKKFILLFVCFFTLSIFVNGQDSIRLVNPFPKKSSYIKKLNAESENLENARKFLKIVDSNKDVKSEYLLGLYHFKKSRRELGKSLLGLGMFGILGAIASGNEDETIGYVAVGALGYSLYTDLVSIIHTTKAMKHFNNAYKLAGISPARKR
jgi:hypothetical protein